MQEVYLLNYQGASVTAMQGTTDLLALANRFAPEPCFQCEVIDVDAGLPSANAILIVPPCMSEPLPEFDDPKVLAAIQQWAAKGHIVASNCAGVFWLAEAGILAGRIATTHWALFDRLQRYAEIKAVDRRHMVIDEGYVLTAAGLFAYQDLALHLIQRFSSTEIAQQVADFSLLDFANRSQLYYQHYIANLAHRDDQLLSVQRYCQQADLAQISVKTLASQASMSERTLTRRFMKQLGVSPGQYLLSLKMEQARNDLRLNIPTSLVAERCGYQDISNFNRAFKKQTNLTPAEYRNRQAQDHAKHESC